MARKEFKLGDCARIPDGRVGRVREKVGGKYRLRIRRKSSDTHQFLLFSARELKAVECPKGWMSPGGYARYLRATLKKAKDRAKSKKAKKK